MREYSKVLKLVNQVDYTDVSWNNYQEVIKNNKMTSNNSPDEIDVAITNIKEAQLKLVQRSSINRNYSDNEVKEVDIASTMTQEEFNEIVNAPINSKVDMNEYDIKYYDNEVDKNPISTIELKYGGTTNKIYMEAIAKNEEDTDILFEVVFKYGSVTIGDNEDYLTIEDALHQSESGDTIIVKYNTSFTEANLAEKIYGSKTFELKDGVKLLIPYDETHDLKGIELINGGPYVSREKFPYSSLTISKNLTVDIHGDMIVGATTGYTQPNGGFVAGNDYGMLELNKGSKVNIKENASLNIYGFSTGEGLIEAESGSVIKESMVISQFKGGTITSGIVAHIFPFDVYNFSNIENNIKINPGVNYTGTSHVNVSSSNVHADVSLIGTDNALFTIHSGHIIKSIEEGKTVITTKKADIAMNDIAIDVGTRVETEDKYMPIPGAFEIHLETGSSLDLNVNLKLLPDSKIYVDDSSELIVKENAKLHIYGSNEYAEGKDHQAYKPTGWYNTFRKIPTSLHSNANNRGNLVVDGTIDVEGTISGQAVTNNEQGARVKLGSGFKAYSSVPHIKGLNLMTSDYYYFKDTKDNYISNPGEYRLNTDGQYSQEIIFVDKDGNEVKNRQVYGERWNLPKNYSESYKWFDSDGNQIIKGRFYGLNNIKVVEKLQEDTFEVTLNHPNQEDMIIKVEKGSKIYPDKSYRPTKNEGDVFLGWYKDEVYTDSVKDGIDITEDTTLYPKWAENGVIIGLDLEGEQSDNDKKTGRMMYSKIIVTVADEKGNKLSDVDVRINATNIISDHNDKEYITNEEGEIILENVRFQYQHTNPIANSLMKTEVSVIEVVSESFKSGKATISITHDPKACPLVYSYDGENYHLEHLPVRNSIIKNHESITHGTLRKLKEIDNQYNIRITEETNTETYTNGINLYAVDYLTNDVQEMLADIFGNPHTIKHKLKPKSFVDSKRDSWLEEVTTEDKLIKSDIELLNQGQYTDYYEAVFDRPKPSNEMAKFMVSFKLNDQAMLGNLIDWFFDRVDGQNNIWWLEEAFEKSNYAQELEFIRDISGLQIELWDGKEWIKQGTVTTGFEMTEEFLIPLDLTLLDEEIEEVKVRLRSGTGFYDIDQVSIDFSEDEMMDIQKLELNTALLNEVEEVGHIVDDLNNDQRVEMHKGDYMDLYYNVPELEKGYERGFVVDFKGYYYHLSDSKKNPIIDTWDDLTFEELIAAVLEEQPEAIEVLPVLEEFSELVESLKGKSLDERIQKIIVENVLPWLDEK